VFVTWQWVLAAVDKRAIHSAAPNIASAPAAIPGKLSKAMRDMVIIAKPARASNSGRTPHLRHAGVQKNASGMAANIRMAYARNHGDPGTLIPRGASNSTRQAGHFGINAKTSEEHDEDATEDNSGCVETRGTVTRSYAEKLGFALVCLHY
jgi:hypothetical protein